MAQIEETNMKKENINIPRCICCGQNESSHFQCEVCRIGMCDDCYDDMREHNGIYNRPYENLEEEHQKQLIKNLGNEPEYICDDCLDRAITKK